MLLPNTPARTCLSILSGLLIHLQTCAAPLDPLDACNVVWTTPSSDHNGSMPIGNGDLGANVWMNPRGTLTLLLSKTDAWSENARLLKLGRVQLSLSPNPFDSSTTFLQTLDLRRGEITFQTGTNPNQTTIRIWIDAHHPVVHVESDSPTPLQLHAELDLWRNNTRTLSGEELNSAYGLHGAPFEVRVHPDTLVQDTRNALTWYHRNNSSIYENNLRHQGLEGFLPQSTDPLLNLTFGASIQGTGLTKSTPTRLESEAPSTRSHLTITALTSQTDSADSWLQQLAQQQQAIQSMNLESARSQHQAWWNNFWNRSWIRLSQTPDAAHTTQVYTLQRWITACAGRGRYPIKFNGSIFTVDGKGFDADYRAWGGPYWWQNTRLPYWPLLASGDHDLMQPLFQMYQDTLPLAEYRTQTWFGHQGAFIGETIYFWGMYNNNNYGWERPDDLPVNQLTNPYIHREYTASLELLAMMLDYHAYTEDPRFLHDELLPLSDSLLTFWDLHYPTLATGRMHIYPAQALETLQDAENPTPDVAGLRWVLNKLLALPPASTSPTQRKLWSRLLEKTPPIPMGGNSDARVIVGAETIHGGRGNSENPELYAVFPFRLFGINKPNLDIGRRTFEQRTVKGNNGWRQDDTQAAFLGLTDIAAEYVRTRAKTKHAESRFPAFWGPNFDWIPDQDHGGNLMMTLQTMLLQTEDNQILLFPAWPAQWDVDFKLHAPRNTTVEATLRNGQITRLEVTPASRLRDVLLPPGSSLSLPGQTRRPHANEAKGN